MKVLGLDLGSSFTDFVVLEENEVRQSKSVLSNGLDLESELKALDLSGVQLIKATGCYARNLAGELTGLPVKKVDEIQAIGLGGQTLSGLDQALTVSIGSGTCLVSVKGSEFRHVGGTAVGGKTIEGLGQLLLQETDFEKLEALAEKGHPEKVDLTLKKIYPQGIGLLDSTATAAHFGALDKPAREDLALALLNMAGQVIGSVAGFAAKAEGLTDLVFTGKLAQSALMQKIIQERIMRLLKVNFMVPEQAAIATALGAALYEKD